jgi:GNAT superfamily N-acetyltransferase
MGLGAACHRAYGVGAHIVDDGIVIDSLAAHPEALPVLERLFKTEWPSYYGADGPGDAALDLRSFCNRGSLPVGVVALRNGHVCGVAALKSQSISSHRNLSPWAAAGLVEPSERRRGIGGLLLTALEHEARALGFRFIYCATNTAESLLLRNEWQFVECTVHDGEELRIYSKPLHGQLFRARFSMTPGR